MILARSLALSLLPLAPPSISPSRPPTHTLACASAAPELAVPNISCSVLIVTYTQPPKSHASHRHALPLGDSRANALRQRFTITGIPSLVLIKGSDGSVITEQGREAILLPNDFPWTNFTASGQFLLETKNCTLGCASLADTGVPFVDIRTWCSPSRHATRCPAKNVQLT